MDVFIESIHETMDRLSRPVAAIEELDLEPPEELFHRGVVGRAVLLRHGARDSGSLAPLDPAGPSVMAAMGSTSFSMAGFMYTSTLMRRIVPLGICPNGTIRYPV